MYSIHVVAPMYEHVECSGHTKAGQLFSIEHTPFTEFGYSFGHGKQLFVASSKYCVLLQLISVHLAVNFTVEEFVFLKFLNCIKLSA